LCASIWRLRPRLICFLEFLDFNDSGWAVDKDGCLSESRSHFKKSTGSYLVKDENLSGEEKVGLEALKAFVARFRPGPCVTREGSPVLDEEGKPTFGARHINTKGVLKAPNRAVRKELFGNRILFFLLVLFLARFYLVFVS
jgi:hypothetical protein